MSASERLAALIALSGPSPSMYATQNTIDAQRMNERVLAALPEIVAVVEAAERVVHADDALILTGLGPHPTPCIICAALAALEEKLK